MKSGDFADVVVIGLKDGAQGRGYSCSDSYLPRFRRVRRASNCAPR